MAIKRGLVFLILIALVLISFFIWRGNKDITGLVFGEKVKLADGPLNSFKTPPASIGDVKADVDEEKSISKVFPADGTEISLKVTDANGAVWTLTLPGKALMEKTKIILTPLTNIRGDTSIGKITSGVRMEPSGLRFLTPANLSVSMPGNKQGLMLTGKNTGRDIDYAMMDFSQEGVHSKIFHFSTAFFADIFENSKDSEIGKDPNFIEWALNMTRVYEEARNAVKELLKQPLVIPPPPSITLNCKTEKDWEEAEKQVAKYMEEFGEHENVLISRIRTLGYILSKHSFKINDDSLQLMEYLAKRRLQKIDFLIKTYYPQPDKFIAVSRTVMSYWRSASVFGVEAPEANDHRLYSWAQKNADYYLNELKVKHDYSAYSAVISLGRSLHFMGSDHFLADPKNLDELLKFKLIYEANYSITDGTQNYVLKGEIPLDKTISHGIGGEGIIKYVSFKDEKHLNDNVLVTKSFPVKVAVRNFDPCDKKTVDFLISGLGAKNEQYANKYGKIKFSWPVIGTNSMALNIPSEEVDGEYYHLFTMPIQNRNIDAADKEFEWFNGTIKIRIKLVKLQ